MATAVVTAEYLNGPDGPAWFTEICAAKGVTGGSRVISVALRPVGTGQVGESVRFDLTWDSGASEGRPNSVIGKFPSQDPQTRETARMVQTYEREFGFYSALQPRVTIRTPHAYHIAIDPPTGDFTLIMEDLRGAVQGDQLGGCDLDSALLIAEAAAGLHAPTWDVTATLSDRALNDRAQNDRAQNDRAQAALDWLAFPDEATTRDRKALFQAVLPGFCDRYGARIGPDAVAAAQWLSTKLLDLRSGLADLSEIALCVTHNDFRLDNMLFGMDPGTPALTTVDWQTLSAGYGPVDIAYALGSGMVPELRERHEQQIFEYYLTCLGTVAGSKVGEMTAPMRGQLWEAYRLGSTSGLAMAVIASMIVVRTERGDEMFSVMAERHAAQMATLDVYSMLN